MGQICTCLQWDVFEHTAGVHISLYIFTETSITHTAELSISSAAIDISLKPALCLKVHRQTVAKKERKVLFVENIAILCTNAFTLCLACLWQVILQKFLILPASPGNSRTPEAGFKPLNREVSLNSISLFQSSSNDNNIWTAFWASKFFLFILQSTSLSTFNEESQLYQNEINKIGENQG